MKLNSTAAVLVLASLAASVLVAIDGEAFSLTHITSPWRKIQAKARNLKDRAFSAPRGERSARLNGRSAGPKFLDGPAGAQRVSRSRNDTGNTDAPENGESADFTSKCFIERGANFRKPPKLFFYSSKTHAAETLGCNAERAEQFSLKPVDGDEGDSPQLNASMIQEDLIDSHLFEPNAPTYFLVHGFMASWNGDTWMCDIKDLVLNSTAANVFIVDWSGGSKPLLPIDYSASVSNTLYVGSLLGQFIKSLVILSGQDDAKQYHMIGHSLGAHICGFAGYHVGSLGRITGLDPAGPCFHSDSRKAESIASDSGYLQSHKRRLSPDSADFVVALHTDTALFGLNENCAHYDVYVNGGFKQPDCGASSLTNRVSDLFHLNLKDTFDLNIACAHSYSHELVDTFINFVRASDDKLNDAGQTTSESQVPITGTTVIKMDGKPSEEVHARCYSIAYECADWDSFKAGECGFCRDGDTRCVFTGLSSIQYQSKKLDDAPYEPADADGLDSVFNHSHVDDDDDKFNDEDEDLGDDTVKGPTELDLKPNDRYSKGQHYLRSASGDETCLYHYQIIVAAKRDDLVAVKDEGKYYYYLHLPLELSGRLTDAAGKRLHDRLVQVSHKPRATRMERLRTSYMEALGEQGVSSAYDQADNIDLYTALITFKQKPDDECKDDQTNGSSGKDTWQLCQPLNNIQEARLWSSSEQKLDAVVWVAMHYMSGMNYKARLANSYVLNRHSSEPVKKRNDVDQSDRPNLNELDPKQSRSFGNAIDSATNSVDCLLSVFDISKLAQTKRNFKCNRSRSELQYTVKLQPIKLANGQ